jgi:hypothetical protein
MMSPKNEIGIPRMFESLEYVAASQLKTFDKLQRLEAPPRVVG